MQPLRAIAALIFVLGAVGCTTVTAPSATIPATAPPPPPDTIEVRVFGSIGSSLATIKYTDSINGLTVLPAASLPYVARFASTQTSLFVLVEATVPAPAGIVLTPSVLQVQIVVNGSVFREGFATGTGALLATAEGTWHR